MSAEPLCRCDRLTCCSLLVAPSPSPHPDPLQKLLHYVSTCVCIVVVHSSACIVCCGRTCMDCVTVVWRPNWGKVWHISNICMGVASTTTQCFCTATSAMTGLSQVVCFRTENRKACKHHDYPACCEFNVDFEHGCAWLKVQRAWELLCHGHSSGGNLPSLLCAHKHQLACSMAAAMLWCCVHMADL